MTAPVHPCPVCDYDTPAGLHLCNLCTSRMAQMFERIPETLRAADATLNNTSVSPSVSTFGASAPNEGSPVNLDMSDRLAEYIKRISELAHWINEQEEPNHPRLFTKTFKCAEYLRAMVNEIRKRPYAPDVYQELIKLERRVLSAADRPMVKRPLGECGALEIADDSLEVTRCDGIIEGHETGTTGRCKKCKREHDLTDRITERFAQAWNIIAPLRTCVNALRAAGYMINYERAMKWAQRGHLAPRCDVATRQEGHTPADVLNTFHKMSR